MGDWSGGDVQVQVRVKVKVYHSAGMTPLHQQVDGRGGEGNGQDGSGHQIASRTPGQRPVQGGRERTTTAPYMAVILPDHVSVRVCTRHKENDRPS